MNVYSSREFSSIKVLNMNDFEIKSIVTKAKYKLKDMLNLKNIIFLKYFFLLIYYLNKNYQNPLLLYKFLYYLYKLFLMNN